MVVKLTAVISIVKMASVNTSLNNNMKFYLGKVCMIHSMPRNCVITAYYYFRMREITYPQMRTIFQEVP